MAWRKAGTTSAVLIGLAVAMHEVSTLSKGIVTGVGAWSFTQLQSVGVWSVGAAWQADLTQEQLETWQDLAKWFIALDLIFVAAYGFALWLISTQVTDPVWKVLAAALVAADLLENAFFLFAANARDELGTPAWLVLVTSLLTTAKWLLVVLVVIRSWLVAQPSWLSLWPWVRAVWLQRFSLLAFLPVALLSVLPGPSVFDQLPDVQRAWLDASSLGGTLWEVLKPAAIHGLVVLPAIFVLGRLRAEWAFQRSQSTPLLALTGAIGWLHRVVWLFGPVLLILLAITLTVTGSGDVKPPRLIAFVAVAVIVFLFSAALATIQTGPGLPGVRAQDPRELNAATANKVLIVGDVMAVASVSMAGLGLGRVPYIGLGGVA